MTRKPQELQKHFTMCHLLTLLNVLTNMNKQCTKLLLHYLLIFVNVNENTVFIVVDFNNALVNAEIDIK